MFEVNKDVGEQDMKYGQSQQQKNQNNVKNVLCAPQAYRTSLAYICH